MSNMYVIVCCIYLGWGYITEEILLQVVKGGIMGELSKEQSGILHLPSALHLQRT
jgi:hypothetical protein